MTTRESDRLLAAIVLLAQKPMTPAIKGALRPLIVRCSREITLDF
jgi:hypothetical protein